MSFLFGSGYSLVWISQVLGDTSYYVACGGGTLVARFPLLSTTREMQGVPTKDKETYLPILWTCCPHLWQIDDSQRITTWIKVEPKSCPLRNCMALHLERGRQLPCPTLRCWSMTHTRPVLAPKHECSNGHWAGAGREGQAGKEGKKESQALRERRKTVDNLSLGSQEAVVAGLPMNQESKPSCMLHCPTGIYLQNTTSKIQLLGISRKQPQNIKQQV